MQVAVGEPDEEGCRSLGVYSCGEQVSVACEPTIEALLTCHAEGVVTPEVAALSAVQAVAFAAGEWPPGGSEPLVVDDLYEALVELGLEYGPVFRGLRSAWRHGDELFAEVVLPEGLGEWGWGFHVCILRCWDGALHVFGGGFGGWWGPRVPFSWSGVGLGVVLRFCGCVFWVLGGMRFL